MPKYTRRHYIEQAAILREARNQHRDNIFLVAPFNTIVELWAMVYESDNPRFNRARFLAACTGANPPAKG